MHTIKKFISYANKSELVSLRSLIDRALEQHSCIHPLKDFFTDVPYLNESQLAVVTESFSKWLLEAKTAQQKRTRGRLWLAFILIRYGGLRLNELLALDTEKDFELENQRIIIRNSKYSRNVPLPFDITQKILKLLASPMFATLHGKGLQIDQGYLRRNFYNRAKECHLPQRLLSPRALRYARLTELLRDGVPAQAVQSFMGQSSSTQAEILFSFSDDTAEQLIEEYLTAQMKPLTSARNIFRGKVCTIAHYDILIHIDIKTVAGTVVRAIITEDSFNNLGIKLNNKVTATVKAPWVSLGDDPVLPCAQKTLQAPEGNFFAAIVVSIKQGKFVSEVTVELADRSILCSVVPTEDILKNATHTGSSVSVFFSAYSVILNTNLHFF